MLLVGLVGEHARQHATAIQRSVLSGLERPGAFAVGDGRDLLVLGAFVRPLGRALRALSLVSAVNLQRPTYLPATAVFSRLPPATPGVRAPSARVREGARMQWHKLRQAWRLMEVAERTDGEAYALVVKLRFDATPLDRFRPCASAVPLAEPTGLVLHAATDKVFWGSRASVETAVALYDVLGTFERPAATPLERPVVVRPLLAAALATPAAAWSTRREERRHYNKVAMVPFPHVGSVASAVAKADPRTATLAHIRAALAAGHEVVSPAATHDAAATLRPVPAHGLRASALDRVGGAFIAERDFLVHLLERNVTVCDLGAGTVALLYKGERHARPSFGCPRRGREAEGVVTFRSNSK